MIVKDLWWKEKKVIGYIWSQCMDQEDQFIYRVLNNTWQTLNSVLRCNITRTIHERHIIVYL